MSILVISSTQTSNTYNTLFVVAYLLLDIFILTLKLISLLIIFFNYFNRFLENDEKSEDNSSYSSNTCSDESTSVSTDKIADENVKVPVDKSDWNKRKLHFTIGSEKPLKRFLYVILVYIFFNIVYGK